MYGVILNGEDLDERATQTARARLNAERSEGLERRAAPFGQVDGKNGADGAERTAARDHPLRENLEVATHAGVAWVRCSKCEHLLSPAEQDWTEACNRKLLPPTKAGESMKALEGHFVLEQLYCPSCAALFETEVVEVHPES